MNILFAASIAPSLVRVGFSKYEEKARRITLIAMIAGLILLAASIILYAATAAVFLVPSHVD